MRKNPYMRRGLQRAGFTGGWLDRVGAVSAASRRARVRARDAALLVLVAACWPLGVRRARATTRRVVRFWAMGREGEVVARAAARVRARASGHPRRRAAAAVDRGAREAADRVRRRRDARHLPARQHLDPRVRRARRARAARRAASPRRRSIAARRLLRRHLGHQRRRRHALRRAVVRRHARCCSIAATCSRGRLRAAAAVRGPEWRARSQAVQRRRGPHATRSCCRSTSSSRCSRWRCSRTSRCCATTAATATSAAPASAARSTSTSAHVPRAARARR